MIKQLLYIILLVITLVSCKPFSLTNQQSKNIAINNNPNTDSLLINVIEPYKISLDSNMNEVIAVSEMEMSTGSPEGLLGNYIADLSLEIGNHYYQKLSNNTADFVLLNNGGFRTFLPKGEITKGKIYEIMPFENELVVVTLSLQKTLDLFAYIGQKTVKEGNRKQGVPVSGNVKIILHETTPTEVLVNNKRITNRSYRIITTDYLANGGDYMSFFINPIKYEKLGLKLRDAIIERVTTTESSGKLVTSSLDKRITYAY
jgi:2',3'-cyclic-nucleotide 2'-phosphodiesterase (5'-nucleotidase family)